MEREREGGKGGKGRKVGIERGRGGVRGIEGETRWCKHSQINVSPS